MANGLEVLMIHWLICQRRIQAAFGLPAPLDRGRWLSVCSPLPFDCDRLKEPLVPTSEFS